MVPSPALIGELSERACRPGYSDPFGVCLRVGDVVEIRSPGRPPAPMFLSARATSRSNHLLPLLFAGRDAFSPRFSCWQGHGYFRCASIVRGVGLTVIMHAL